MDAAKVHLLGDLCEIAVGRNRVAREPAQADPTYRIVRAEDIQQELADWSELRSSTIHTKGSVEIASGDIVGSRSGPYGRWVIVPPGYGPSLASDHTIVLRTHGTVSPWYLLGFLRSRAGRQLLAGTVTGAVIQRINRAELARVPVPTHALNTDYVDQTLTDFDNELRRITTEVGVLRNRLDRLFISQSESQLVTEIDAVRGVTASLRKMTEFSDTLRIAQISFPYPIARALRAIERSTSPSDRYHEVAHRSIETISALLAGLCASIAGSTNIRGDKIKAWVSAITRGGATLGRERAMILQVAEELAHQGDIGGIARSFADAGTPAPTLLAELLEERNRVHGDYPRTAYQFQQRLTVVEGTLRQFLDSASFLARWELRYAESVEPAEDETGAIQYSARLRVLQSDNPDWDLIDYTSKSVMFPGRLYALVDDRKLMDLHPYLVVRYCPECGSQEIYQVDSFNEDGARLKSIDRGHSHTTSDTDLLRQLHAATLSLRSASEPLA